jgi:hypothetical protein
MKNLVLAMSIIILSAMTFSYAVAPCVEDANKICSNDVNSPNFLGVIDVNEGTPIKQCVEIFDCNTGEQTGITAYHSIKRVKSTLPTGVTTSTIIPVDCNSFSFDVNSASDCKGCNSNHCSKMNFEWVNTIGRAGTYEWTDAADNISGGRTYYRVVVIIRHRTTPNAHLGGCGN